jgi:Zn-dependent peptidase ImmA (M78 family)
VEDFSIKEKKTYVYSGPISLALLESTPFAKSPVEAILFHAEMLILESGMKVPPFSPMVYAPLRRIKEVLYSNINVDGRLIPVSDGFVIELRKDRPTERKNFTFAHELAHTFFFETVPSTKYRNLDSEYHKHDDEEEKLCDIAASELLMPAHVFSKVIKDFVPSAEAVQEIAQLFETSLLATIIKIHVLNLWDASFVLWKLKNKTLEPSWLARPKKGMIRSPGIEMVNGPKSSVFHTLTTGESTSALEWFCLDDGYKLSRFQSIRLNSSTVLSCLTNSKRPGVLKKMDEPTLPLTENCNCDGAGWYHIEQGGIKYARRCKSKSHRNPFQEQQFPSSAE